MVQSASSFTLAVARTFAIAWCDCGALTQAKPVSRKDAKAAKKKKRLWLVS